MNALLVTVASLAALAAAAPSGHIAHVGVGVVHNVGLAEAAVLKGPSGIVTNHGAIGPVGHGLGLGWGGDGGWGGNGGWGGWGAGGWGHGAVVAAAPVAVAAPIAVAHHGAGVITNGGGTIGVSAHGAAIRGPPTAPVVVAGPSGKVAADGLWGPTANVGLGHGHGGWGHGGHGW